MPCAFQIACWLSVLPPEQTMPSTERNTSSQLCVLLRAGDEAVLVRRLDVERRAVAVPRDDAVWRIGRRGRQIAAASAAACR